MGSPAAEMTAVAAPVPRRRRRLAAEEARRRRRARGGVLWIAVSAVLLAGVVFVNVGVLRLNLGLDEASRERAKLRGENAALQSELSSSLASPRVQTRARHELGLEPADPATFGYVDLSR
jgi:cell division protein FtsL